MDLHIAVDRWKDDLKQIKEDRKKIANECSKINRKIVEKYGYLKGRLYLQREPINIKQVIFTLETYDRILDLIFFKPRDQRPDYSYIYYHITKENNYLSELDEKLLNKSEYELKFFLKKHRFPFFRKPKYDFDIVIDFIDDYYDHRNKFRSPQEQLNNFWRKHNI